MSLPLSVSGYCLPASLPLAGDELVHSQKALLQYLLSPLFCEWLGSAFSSVQFNLSVVSDFLWPQGSQHTRPPCPSSTSVVYSNSCPSSRWSQPVILSAVIPFSSCIQSLPASGSFSNESTPHEVAKYWSFSFSISLSKEHPGLISFRMDWLDLLAVQGTLKSLLQHHNSKP